MLSGESAHQTSACHSREHIHQGHEHYYDCISQQQKQLSSGVIEEVNHGQDFCCIGWRFSKDKVFDKHKLAQLFQHLSLERL
ncbi:hypothetical protein [Pseudoalteromonas sp.]|uniref:hypothetical protein n=1 Tax=Pseudoalteromonas sp. TaxID=53249 RepID=UPI00356AAF4F